MAARFEHHSFSRLDGDSLSPLDQAGPSESFLASRFRDKTVQVSGTYVGDVQVEASLDGTWVPIGAVVSGAPTLIEIPFAVRFVRVNVTAYTSGTIAATFGGFDQRVDH